MRTREVIIPLDFSSAQEAYDFLGLFPAGEKPYVKVGMELFYAEGPEIVRELKRRGHKIFLDLKLHDIPNTVMKAMANLSKLDVDLTNLHAAGTSEMMKAAIQGLTRPDGTRPLLIAVTQLTSTSEAQLHDELLISASMEDTVLRYAENAKAAGLDGIVCSPHEVRRVKAVCGQDFLAVTPGIRFAGSAAPGSPMNPQIHWGGTDDQSRVMTPAKAREAGSDYIVVGRPIIAANDPLSAYRRCMNEFLG